MRGGRGPTRRRRGRAAGLVLGVFALLALGAVAGAVAVIFGLVPGFRIVSPIQSLPDTAAADTATRPGTTPARADTTAFPPLPPVVGDTLGVAGLVSAADSAAGDAVYRGPGRCLSCHGVAGEGVARLGPDLRDDRWVAGDGSVASIARAVREGVSPPREFPIAMPAYAGQLSEEDIARVAAYVYTLSHPGAVPRDPVPADSVTAPVPFP